VVTQAGKEDFIENRRRDIKMKDKRSLEKIRKDEQIFVLGKIE
jgi:hypothetical protein